jgi:hypothetical protein
MESMEIPLEIRDKFLRKKLYYIRQWGIAYFVIATGQWVSTITIYPDDKPLFVNVLYGIYAITLLC